MPKRLSMLKKILRKDAQTENIESTNLPGNPQTPELRCGGSSPARHDGEPQNAASEVADTASSRTSVESRNDVATPSKADNLWVKAEQKLMDDSNKSKLWQSYLDILASELGSDLKPSGTDERQNQLCQLFEAKTQELEEKRWKIRFGDHTTTVGDLLKRVSKNVIIAKDIINTAARASPPAAIACAGVTVVLTLVVQAEEQHDALLSGLDRTSTSICRLLVMEDVYRSGPKLQSLDPKHVKLFKEKFESSLTELYSKILEFQARGLCYLHKHEVTKKLRDMFKQDGWDILLQGIEESEKSIREFKDLIDAEDMRRSFEKLEKAQEKYKIWQTLSARDERVKRFLNRLYTCPYRDRKDRNPARVPDTCEWFTNHDLFRSWLENQGSSLLWVSADPGCGKSVLAKYLIDDVLLSTSKRTTCYFFFKDDFSDQKGAANAICAILRQLFLAKPDLLGDSLLHKLDIDGDKFIQSFHDLWSTLLSVTSNQNAGEIVCILDALDECQESGRSQLIRSVRELYLSQPTMSCLKILLTSKPYDHIRRELRELENRLPTIHLSGENEDEVEKISREIDLVIKYRVEDISKKRSLEPDEYTLLETCLTSIPNRTYLWVTLTLDVIENIPEFTKGNIRRTMRQIPISVDEAYDRILNRSTDVQRAKRLLHIVTAARRPLSLKEMALAMAIEETHRTYDDIMDELQPDDRFRVSIRNLCGLFVVIVNDKIYLLHQTAREFLVWNESPALLKDHLRLDSQGHILKWKYSLQLQESNRILAERCVWYLMFDFVETRLPTLLAYSSLNWVDHFRQAGIRSEETIAAVAQSLCEPESTRFKTWTRLRARRRTLAAPTHSIIIASFLGLDAIVKGLLDSNAAVNSKNEFGETPLLVAAVEGHEAVVELLLATGEVDVDARDNDGRTPLLAAADEGHEAVMELLLASGKADVDARDNSGCTPLLAAVWNGNRAVMELLLATGKVDIDARDNDGCTPLLAAVEEEHEALVELLLASGKADVDARNNNGCTPLLAAVWNGNRAVVELLLATGKVDVDARDNDGWTPLLAAVEEEHEAVMELLLASGKGRCRCEG